MDPWTVYDAVVTTALGLWVIGYSWTLLKRTKVLVKIFGPIPEKDWDQAALVIGEELRALVEKRKRDLAIAEYQRTAYPNHD
jgi:hypothetical protein